MLVMKRILGFHTPYLLDATAIVGFDAIAIGNNRWDTLCRPYNTVKVSMKGCFEL